MMFACVWIGMRARLLRSFFLILFKSIFVVRTANHHNAVGWVIIKLLFTANARQCSPWTASCYLADGSVPEWNLFRCSFMSSSSGRSHWMKQFSSSLSSPAFQFLFFPALIRPTLSIERQHFLSLHFNQISSSFPAYELRAPPNRELITLSTNAHKTLFHSLLHMMPIP